MKFNHELKGLDNNDRLSLDELEMSVQELRYALDQVCLNEVAESLLQSLKTYGVTIVAQDGGEWLRQGLEISLFKADSKIMQTGRLKLKFGLEFCPDRVEEVDLTGEHLDAGVTELAIKVAPYLSPQVPIPCITLIRSSNDC